jgi:hypothetical protein
MFTVQADSGLAHHHGSGSWAVFLYGVLRPLKGTGQEGAGLKVERTACVTEIRKKLPRASVVS